MVESKRITNEIMGVKGLSVLVLLSFIYWVNHYGKYCDTHNGKCINPLNDNCGITINGSLPLSMMEKV